MTHSDTAGPPKAEEGNSVAELVAELREQANAMLFLSPKFSGVCRRAADALITRFIEEG